MTRHERIAYAHSKGMHNVGAILAGADVAGVSDAVALALFELETHGQMVVGHDPGGALSTGRAGTPTARTVTVAGNTYPPGSDVPAGHPEYAEFLILVSHGVPSNGWGMGQATYFGDLPDGRWGGYHRLAASLGYDLCDPYDNAEFSLAYMFSPGGFARRDLEGAFGAYNGGPKWRDDPFARDYAQRGLRATVLWRGGFRELGI